MSEAIQRAQRAELILGDDVFRDAIQKIRAQALEDFRNAKPDDDNALRTARMSYEVTERFVSAFTNIVRDGVAAQRRAPPATHPANTDRLVQ